MTETLTAEPTMVERRKAPGASVARIDTLDV